MTRPTSRVLALLEILQSGGTRRVADLAARLDVDERTLRRYAQHLLDVDVPVRTVRGRYGGYRLAPGYKMPPLMLTDDEAVAVAVGLAVGRRAGLLPESSASASAVAKLRRVLPTRLGERLDALLWTSSFTAPLRSSTSADTDVLLTLAEAAEQRHPVAIGYTDRLERRTTRTVHPYGVVGHAGRWYVVAEDPTAGEVRTFRVDRITTATLVAGSFEAAPGTDPATTVLESLARTPWLHRVEVRVRGEVDDVHRRLPLGIADVVPVDSDPEWVVVRMRAERLDWVPALLAGLDLPFVIVEPDELRGQLRDHAQRLSTWADTPAH